MKSIIIGLLLAAGSFAFARYHYNDKNTAKFTVGKDTSSIKNPFADKHLFGDWMQDEWILAIAVPAACLAGGIALSLKK